MANGTNQQSAKPAWLGNLAKTRTTTVASKFEPIKEQLAGWIAESYDIWAKDNESWRITEFATEADRDEAAAAGKWYCDKVADPRRTFMTKATDHSQTLMYRVRDKIGKPRNAKHDTPATASTEQGGK